jgi:hypothetical protein
VIDDDDDIDIDPADRVLEQQIADMVGWVQRLAAHYPRLTTKKSRRIYQRRIDRAITWLDEVIGERCPEVVAELTEMRAALAELVAVADASYAPVRELAAPDTVIALDDRARIRESRAYEATTGPPRAHENGLDARLLSRSGGRFSEEPKGGNPGLACHRAIRLSRKTSAVGNPENSGNASVCPGAPRRGLCQARGPPRSLRAFARAHREQRRVDFPLQKGKTPLAGRAAAGSSLFSCPENRKSYR